MKKILLVVAILTLGLNQACDGKVKNETSEKVEVKSESSSKTVADKPIKISKADFLVKVMNYEQNQEWKYEGDLPCLIDFYADWCGPCKTTAPILDELAKEYAGKINIYKVDVQVEKELAQVFGVQGIPAFLYCPKEGKPQMTSGIARSKKETKEMFRKAIDEILLQNKM